MPNESTDNNELPAEEDSSKDKTGLLGNRTTQLAVGAAATLGLLLLYKLRQKAPADDVQGDDAAVERVKAALRAADMKARKEARRKSHSIGGRRLKERRSESGDEGAT